MKPTTATVNSLSTKNRIREGVGQYGISSTSYDFLRIAKVIMDDWQNDTYKRIHVIKDDDFEMWQNFEIGNCDDTSAARKWKNASSFESLWIVEAK